MSRTFDPDGILTHEEWAALDPAGKVKYMGLASLRQLEASLTDDAPQIRKAARACLIRRWRSATEPFDSYILDMQRHLIMTGYSDRAEWLKDPDKKEDTRKRRVFERLNLGKLILQHLLTTTTNTEHAPAWAELDRATKLSLLREGEVNLNQLRDALHDPDLHVRLAADRPIHDLCEESLLYDEEFFQNLAEALTEAGWMKDAVRGLSKWREIAQAQRQFAQALYGYSRDTCNFRT